MMRARGDLEDKPDESTAVQVERWTSRRSEVRIWTPCPGIIRFKYFGFNEAASVPWMGETANRMVRAGPTPVDMFVDCWDQEGYEPGFRTGLTEWNKRIQSDIRSMPLLIRSKIASMGITVSNIALGGLLVPYTDRQTFDREIMAATARANANARGL
jgi:hypothetical protein